MYIGEPAPPGKLIDRQDEVGKIASKCMNRNINYALAVLGYRRVGKTTILLEAKSEMEKKGIIVVYFDVKKNMGNPARFFTRLEKTVLSEYFRQAGWRGKAGTVAKGAYEKVIGAMSKSVKSVKGASISLTVKPDGTVEIEPKIEFGKSPDYGDVFDAVFTTIKKLADGSDKKVVVILDEFQDMEKLKPYRGLRNTLDKFRSVIQERGSNLSYVISGSKVHMIREFIEKGGGAAFMHFVEVDVDQLPNQYAVQLFETYCRAVGTDNVQRGAEEAYKLVGGNPFYLMILAENWDGTSAMDAVYRELLKNPRKQLALYAEYVLTEDLMRARRGESALREILEALADGAKSVSEIAKTIGRRQESLPEYLQDLARYDMIIAEQKKYSIRDRLIKDYLLLNRGSN